MTESPFVVEISSKNFETSVIAASDRVPVLVDFWASWCGPCQVLLPLLTRLAQEYQGQFLLAKVNIDEQPQLAQRFGVRSVPTVKLFRNGEMVEEFLGAQPESFIRPLIDAHIERESDRVLATAVALAAEGELAPALSMIERCAATEPDNPRLRLGQAELLVAADQLEEAEALLRALPADMGARPEVVQLLARVAFANVARGAPAESLLADRLAGNPRDSEARYQLGARRVMRGDFEGALEQLLELVRSDRAFGDDAGRNGMLRIFDLLGGEGDLVSRYRRMMFNALH